MLSDGRQFDWADGGCGADRCGLKHGTSVHLLLMKHHTLWLQRGALGMQTCLAALHQVHHLLTALRGGRHPSVPIKRNADWADHAHVQPHLSRTQHKAMVNIRGHRHSSL